MAFDPDALPVPDLGLCCLKCGYGLAGLASHRCPECGKPFTMEEHIPEGDFPVVIFRGKEVTDSPDVVELLKRYSIPHVFLMWPGQTMFGSLATSEAKRRVGVPRASYFRVIDLLRRQALGEEMPPADGAIERPAWTCAACEEENPGTFDVCWNCGRPAPDAGDHMGE